MADVINSWNNVVPICGNHKEERVEMIINSGPHSLFYSCPRYYSENRKDGEIACNNRINLIEYEAMVRHLHEMIAEADLNGEQIDLTNYKWKKKGICYRVLEHKGDKLYVEILNRRAMRS